MLLFIGLFLFVLLVVLHEYGHFLVAKRNGVEVEEFGVGFPPKLFGKKLGKGIFEGYYTINLLPLGGFVRLKGESDSDRRKGSFGAVSTPAKLRIMLAGVAVNLVTALLMFTFVAWVGMPQVIDNQFTVASDSKVIRADVLAGYVEPGSPAEKAGITGGSKIISLNGTELTEKEQLTAISIANAGKTVPVVFEKNDTITESTITFLSNQQVTISFVEPGSPADKAGLVAGATIISVNGEDILAVGQLPEVTKANAGKNVEIVFKINGNQKTTSANLLSTQEVNASSGSKGYLGVTTDRQSNSGIVPTEYTLVQSTWSAPIVAVGLSAQLTGLTLKALGEALFNLFQAFGSAITGQGQQAKQEAAKAGENVSGPVGIYAVLKQGASLGFQFVLFVVAIISLTLAIMNALPIPALDGGRAAVMLAFRAAKKPLTQRTEELIHGIGFMTLIGLFIVITIVDIRRFF